MNVGLPCPNWREIKNSIFHSFLTYRLLSVNQPSPENNPLYGPDFTLMDILQKLLLVSIAEKVLLFFRGIGNYNFLGFHFFPNQQECQDSLPHLCYSGSSKRRTMPNLSDLWPISKAADVIDMKETVGLFSSSPHYYEVPSLKRSPVCLLRNCLIWFGIHICSVHLSFGHCVFKAFEWFLSNERGANSCVMKGNEGWPLLGAMILFSIFCHPV